MAGATVAPAAGSVVNGTFSCTFWASTIAATNRTSPLHVTACPGLSPCAAANPSRPAAVLEAPEPPAPAPRRALPRVQPMRRPESQPAGRRTGSHRAARKHQRFAAQRGLKQRPVARPAAAVLPGGQVGLQLEIGAAPAAHRQARKRAAAGLVFAVRYVELLLHSQLDGRYSIAGRDRWDLSIRAFQRRVESVRVRGNVGHISFYSLPSQR